MLPGLLAPSVTPPSAAPQRPVPPAASTTQRPVAPPSVASPTPMLPTGTGTGPAAPASGWFTVLDSLSKQYFTAGQARAFGDRMAAERGRPVVVVDSDATQGMGPDYYVVGEGLAADKAAGEQVCPAWGRRAGGQDSDCYAKQVTYGASPAEECARVAGAAAQACTGPYGFVVANDLGEQREPGGREYLKGALHLDAFESATSSVTVRVIAPYQSGACSGWRA